MKKIIYYLPVALLLSYIGYCFYRPPQIADSIIIIAIAALYGFLMFVKSKEIDKPILTDKQQELVTRLDELHIQRQIVTLEIDLARSTKAKEAPSVQTQRFEF